MNLNKNSSCKKNVLQILIGFALFQLSHQSTAFDISTGSEDISLRWDNTIKYSALHRIGNQDSLLVSDVNLDDGDRNFNNGLVSNRIDILSELDIAYQDRMGFRLSGAAWYDSLYNRDNDHNSPGTANNFSTSYNRFNDDTRRLMGRDVEVLDAFGYIDFDLAGKPTVFRLGRHSLLYGETLFFGANGVAGGQSPVDLNKLLSVPGSQFKEIIRPVGQASFQTQVNDKLTIGGYYQFEWDETRLPASGSYLSAADFNGDGAERFLAGSGAAFYKGQDLEADDQGQGGLQMRIRPGKGEWEYGLYLTHYHDKTGLFYFLPRSTPFVGTAGDLNIGEFVVAYPENITSLGASISGVLGQTNVAAEVSHRWNQPMVSDPQTDLGLITGNLSDNDDNELFARGDSLHLNLSAIGFLGKSTFWDGGSWLAEIAYNQRLSVDKNPAAIDPNTTKSASAFRGVLTLNYFQVMPNLDVSVPIGIGYNLHGKSSVIFNFNGGAEHGGDFSIGMDARYKQVWSLSARYVNYFGRTDTFLTPANAAVPVLSYGQALQDRDFISLSIQRTF